MQIYKKYIALNLILPAVVITLTLTAIIWLSQSLRFIDLIVNKGLGVSTFLYLSLLLVPSLMMIILPIALFVAILFVYNKLSTESELLVFKSAGVSRFGLAVPAIMVATGVMIVVYIISLYVLPKSYREFKDMQDFIRNNYASILLQEGVFSTPVDRLTVYIESRDKDGILHGILVHDARNPERPSTMMAQQGKLLQTPTGPRFELLNGNRQEIDKKNGNLSLLYFDSYPLDLSIYTDVGKARSRTAEERFVHELFQPEENDPRMRSSLIAEGNHRIVWPFLTITFTMVALAILFSGQFNRRGNWKRILAAAVVIIIIAVLDLAIKNLSVKNTSWLCMLYLNALLPTFFALYILLTNHNINADFLYKAIRYSKEFLNKKRLAKQ